MNNNRRQFIKKSFFAGILGVFAPSLIAQETDRVVNSRIYLFERRHEYHRFKDGNFYYRFYKPKISAVILTDNEDYYWAETPREINKIVDFIKIKNYIIWMEKDYIKVKIIFN